MKTHPPLVNGVVAVDFDGTIIPWGPLMARRKPFPGVPQAMRALREAGFRIVIFTSRMSPSWLADASLSGLDALGDQYPEGTFTEAAQAAFITKTLTDAGIPFDSITSEKVPAQAYFDDKAVAVRIAHPLDLAISEFLLTNGVTA